MLFRLKGLPRAAYKKLESENKDPKDDEGWDADTFPEVLVRACLVHPVVGADQPLFDVLTSGETDKLFWSAYRACNEVDEIPLVRRA